MSTNCVRFNNPNIPYDALNGDAMWINFGVGGSDARFPTNVDSVSGWFRKNGYLVNAQTHINMEFDNLFTVMFWAKCIDRGAVDGIYGVQWVLTLNDNVAIRVQIPDTVTLTDWNHYSIVRDENNVITFRVNGTTIRTEISSAIFDLSDESCMWFGSKYKKVTGDECIVDDILIFDGAAYTEDFDELPTDYIDVTQFTRLLYIITSTGEVWGYGVEATPSGSTEELEVEDGEW